MVKQIIISNVFYSTFLNVLNFFLELFYICGFGLGFKNFWLQWFWPWPWRPLSSALTPWPLVTCSECARTNPWLYQVPLCGADIWYWSMWVAVSCLTTWWRKAGSLRRKRGGSSVRSYQLSTSATAIPSGMCVLTIQVTLVFSISIHGSTLYRVARKYPNRQYLYNFSATACPSLKIVEAA